MFSIKESICIMWTRTVFDMNRMSLVFIFINHISVNVVHSQSLHFLFKMSIFSCSRALYWTKNEYSKLRRKFETLVQVLLWSQYRWAVFGISSVLHERNFFCFKRWWEKKKTKLCSLESTDYYGSQNYVPSSWNFYMIFNCFNCFFYLYAEDYLLLVTG